MTDDWEADVCDVPAGDHPGVDPAPGLARLESLGQLAADGGKDAASLAIATLLADPSAMVELADAARARRSAVESAIEVLRARPGLFRRGGKLLEGIRALAASRTAEERRRCGRVTGALEQSLAALLRGHRLAGGLRVPDGWDCDGGGVFRISLNPETGEEERLRIAHRPLVVEGRLHDLSDGTVHVALGWPTPRGWTTELVPRQQIAEARDLAKLASLDAPVVSTHARALVEYLSAAEEVNLHRLPTARLAARMGWQGEGCAGFLLGARILTGTGAQDLAPVEDREPAAWCADSIHLRPPDAGLRGIAAGFQTRGTWRGWLEAYALLSRHPRAILPVYASLAAPLLRVIDAANFGVELCGETSRGKTTCLRAAASVWGRPDESGAGLIRTWDATPVFLENLTTFCGDLPLFVDDTRRARSGDDVARVIYNHASGQARGRGSVTGVRGITSSRGVLLMTGETPATAMSNQGGTRARVLSLWGSPFGAADRTAGDTARRVTRLLSEHHGHLGPRLVGWLVGEPNAAAWVRQEYELALAATLQRAGDDPVAGRLAQSVAVLVVCRRVAETWLGLPPPEVDPFDAAWTSMRAGAADADRASAALLDVVAWAAGQQDRLYPGVADEDARKFPPAGGWIGARRGGDAWETLALLPPTVRAFLKTEQYDVEATLRLWGERGWLQRDGKHRGSHVWVGQQRVRCLVIRREAVQAAEGAVPGEDAVSPPGAP